MTLRLDAATGLELDVAVDVGRGGIDDAHAGQHVRVQDASPQRRLSLCQLGQRVDALGGLRRRLVDRHGRCAVLCQQPDHVGQVELALGVLRGQARQRRGERLAPEAVEPDVELVQRQLLGRGVAGLDDARHVLAVAHDAAVGVRRRQPGTHERAAGVSRAGRDCALHRRGLDQRRVAGQHDHELARRRHRLHSHHHGVARSVGRRLHDDADVRQRCGDGLGRLRPGHDDHVVGARLARRADDPGQHRQPA